MPKSKKTNRTNSPTGTTTVLPPSSNELAAPRPTLLATLAHTVRASWSPQPLTPPTVDHELESLSPIERSAEVLRFQLLRLEYALSSGGSLREYLKFNLRLAAVLAIPSFLIAPIITFALGQVAAWSAFLLTTAINFLLTLLVLIAIAAILSGALFVIRALRR